MQFRDLKTQYRLLKDDIDAGIEAVIESSAFILGKEVSELEDKLAAYVGRKYCISCGSGTAALTLALMSIDAGPGDAVFVPDLTYAATAEAAAVLGAVPVFTDIDPFTYNMSPESLEIQIRKVTEEDKLVPKAVIPVDLFGQPADYDSILPVAKKYGLKVIEDGAQGFGGSIRDKKACSFGDISITSFFPSKPLGCYGDGGAVFTDDEGTARRIRSLRALGRSEENKYCNVETGINSRLDTLQAAILLPKLRAFEEYELEAVNRVAARYTDRLKESFVTPAILPGFISSWAQYSILCKDGTEREELQKRLKEQDIPTMIYYPKGLHKQKAFEGWDYADSDFANTTAVSSRILSLPINPYLKDQEVDRICEIALAE